MAAENSANPQAKILANQARSRPCDLIAKLGHTNGSKRYAKDFGMSTRLADLLNQPDDMNL
jgi:hypothetical protein